MTAQKQLIGFTVSLTLIAALLIAACSGDEATPTPKPTSTTFPTVTSPTATTAPTATLTPTAIVPAEVMTPTTTAPVPAATTTPTASPTVALPTATIPATPVPATPTTTPAPTTGPTPTTPAPTPASDGDGPPTIQATIVNFTLPDLTITIGTTVTWTNADGAPHTTTSGTNGQFDGQGWDSPTLSRNDTFSYIFNEAGSFRYTCRFHPSMTGTVTVTDGSG